ncbi:hypothetical protein VTL71DRAFT_11478 [Oculimacula yallundae]|uniref:Uncharacterized protein n=1 Tax=Oculimacula yallundae TaxID=86028 RepID=A0ABR4CQD6_9HELO
METFIVDKVKKFLLDDIVHPVERVFGELVTYAEDAFKVLRDEFNMGCHQIMGILDSFGHELGAVAQAAVNVYNLTMDELGGFLHDLGHDVNVIVHTLGPIFNADAHEIVSAISGTGISTEHAVSSAFGGVGAEMSMDFNMVGNSVAAISVGTLHAVEHFLVEEEKVVEEAAHKVEALAEKVAKKVENVVIAVGEFVEGVASEVASTIFHWFW